MSSLLGGNSHQHQNSTSYSTSQSSNQAFPYLQGALAPSVNNAGGTSQFIGQLLGVPGSGDPTQANNAFQSYLNSTGYRFQLGQGSDAITDNAAARGLLNSGATLKALNSYGQNTAGQYFNNFLSQVLGANSQNLGAAQTLAGAGQQNSSLAQNNSSGSGSSKTGLGL